MNSSKCLLVQDRELLSLHIHFTRERVRSAFGYFAAQMTDPPNQFPLALPYLNDRQTNSRTGAAYVLAEEPVASLGSE